MADLSLDDIIASKKGLNFKVQFSNQNPNKGQANPQRQNFRPGFAANRLGGVQQKRPFSAPGLRSKTGTWGSQVQKTGGILAGPGRGQIDARDMITIKNRIKIPDARAKIVQKRINQGKFDARSKLQSQKNAGQPGGAPARQAQQQQVPFQGPQQPVRPQGQQRFQQPRQQGFQQPRQQGFQQPRQPGFQQPRPSLQQQGPQFSNPTQPFSAQQPFSVQQSSQQFEQLAANTMNQLPPNFNQPPPGFPQSGPDFRQPPPSFQQVSDQTNSPDLINFTVAVNSGPSEPQLMAPLTRTLMNPLASGGALVEDTGNSLKITRSIPDVTFDGQKLTVTRRVPQNSQPSQPPVSSGRGQRPAIDSGRGPRPTVASGRGPRPFIDSDRGPVIQFQNDRVQSAPARAPAPGNMIRTQRGPPPSQQRARPPSPIQSPVKRRVPVKPPNPEPAPARLAPPPAQSTDYITNTRYKTVKNVSPAVLPARAQPQSASQARIRVAQQAQVSAPALKRPAQSAFSRMQMDQEATPISARLSSPGVPVAKRLAPPPSAQSQPVAVSAGAKAAAKRRAPLSLSDRFASGTAGNPIPVITDHAPVKKRRMPEPEPVKEFEEDFEMQGGFEEEEEVVAEEEPPGVTILSPLQGFRILVSNLHASVTQDDIIELFGAIGPLKRANLLTKGQAEVAFIHKEHAVMALKKYHNRELDGQPMFVKLTTPLNAKIMKPAAAEDSPSALPASLRTSKKPAPASSAPVEIPLIHKALFKTGADTAPSKSVRFTVKL